ncbi:hypothetical protein V2J09_007780 [Rumex salicifolius]
MRRLVEFFESLSIPLERTGSIDLLLGRNSVGRVSGGTSPSLLVTCKRNLAGLKKPRDTEISPKAASTNGPKSGHRDSNLMSNLISKSKDAIHNEPCNGPIHATPKAQQDLLDSGLGS